ncbi:hypothetical protein A7U60_g3637 [Sanghuangporus baumii]|uniref:Uncharacterized protein n=1 Tax=Sanghuangporus baumii TaxID=108892 RepID=A0A9Q5I022_SANBA|nr:hypothetical protein A7U60_g3637 [Sanghuangporus baumii]
MRTTIQSSKLKKLALVVIPANASPSTLAETSRHRRQRILKPAKRDPFLATISSRKTLQRRERILGHSRCRRSPCSPRVAEIEKKMKCPTRCSGCGQLVPHEDPEEIGSGAIANALYAKRIPERLQRPVLEDTPPETLLQAGYDPVVELNGLKIARKELVRHGKDLFFAISSTISSPIVATHSGELPAFVTIGVPKTVRAEHMPTHMLAVHNGDPKVKYKKVLLMPVHPQVLAAHCGRVPPIPNPSPPEPTLDPRTVDETCCHSTRVVPLLPFCLPSIETFPLMMRFLCTQDTSVLFRELIPIGPPDGGMWQGDFSRLAEELAKVYTSSSILSGALRVYAVWQNACSLGVLNPALWNVIDMAWKAHRNALLLAQR